MTDPAILRTHYPLILSLRIRRTDVGLESRQKLVVRNNRDVLRFYKKVRPVLANGIMDGSLPSVLLDDLQAEAPITAYDIIPDRLEVPFTGTDAAHLGGNHPCWQGNREPRLARSIARYTAGVVTNLVVTVDCRGRP
jgi:hypothetical protein